MSVIETDEKKIAKSGGSAVLYLSNGAKKYINEGDLVKYQLILEGDVVKIVATKRLHNFSLKDLRDLAKSHGFETEYDKRLDNVEVFDARKDRLTLTYTKNANEIPSPANITVSSIFDKIDYEMYKTVSDQIGKQLRDYNIITRFDGDLDTINVLKEPERYEMDMAEAFKILKKAGRKIGLSVIIRLDNRKESLDQVRTALETMEVLNSKYASK